MRRARIAVVALALAALILAWRLGVLHRFEDLATARATLVGLGPWGYVAFVLAYATLQPFGVPGTVFVLAAPLVWPWPVAYALSMVGSLAASVVGFSFARFVARDWFAARVPARFRRYDDALARHAFATVFVLRFVFWMPQVLHAFFGVSRVRCSTHFWASAAGYALPLLAVSYFGPRFFELAAGAPRSVWLALAGATVALGLVAWAVRRRWRSAR